jgi:hypothetical protein
MNVDGCSLDWIWYGIEGNLAPKLRRALNGEDEEHAMSHKLNSGTAVIGIDIGN